MQKSFSKRETARELIDGPVDSIAQLKDSFRDIAFANKYFGGIAAAKFALRGTGAITVLDVGTGIADIPAQLRRDSLRKGIDLRFTCLDNNELLLQFARERYGADPGMQFVAATGERLPFADGAFDVAMCNLALHHFDPPQAVQMLAELRRVSRITPVVTDLLRSALTFAATLAFSRVFSRNALTRHDGPLSARRAYTLEEARSLASHAGWRAPSVRAFRWIRMVLRDDAAR